MRRSPTKKKVSVFFIKSFFQNFFFRFWQVKIVPNFKKIRPQLPPVRVFFYQVLMCVFVGFGRFKQSRTKNKKKKRTLGVHMSDGQNEDEEFEQRNTKKIPQKSKNSTKQTKKKVSVLCCLVFVFHKIFFGFDRWKKKQNCQRYAVFLIRS